MEIFMAFYGHNPYERFMVMNRFTGPYAPAYWSLILCNIAIPQLLWLRRVRASVGKLFCIAIVVNVGMWLERFIIVVVSMHRDFLNSSWGMYYPTRWDWMTYIGTIGMCGHGTIGLVVTLAHLGRLSPGTHQIETPVGIVGVVLHESGEVTVNNVVSCRRAANVMVDVPAYGPVWGDVAWGGNWFFLVQDHPMKLSLANVEELTAYTWAIRQALRGHGITGDNGAEIDHIELFSPSDSPGVNSKNFVLCPGKAYDRSPCGTGTSAKLACLYADGRLKPGQVWRQESIVGSVFEGTVSIENGQIIPEITGSAYVNAEADLVLDERDPFCYGIRVTCAATT